VEPDFEAAARERNPPLNEAFKRLQAGGFADWRLSVDGMIDRPASFSLTSLGATRLTARSLNYSVKRAGRI